MSLVLDTFAGSCGTTGMTSCEINDCSVRLNRGPILLYYYIYTTYRCQLWQYGLVSHYPEADPAYQVVSERDNPERRQPRGCPQNLRLWQLDASCCEFISMGREPAWGLTRRDHQEWRQARRRPLPPLYATP